MDKETAIKEALKERIERYDHQFKSEVACALREIGKHAENLRVAKLILKEIKYNPPGDIETE